MRTELREKKVNYEVFVAYDGTEFKTADECVKYENSYETTIKASFEKVPHVKKSECNIYDGMGCDEYDVYLVKPRNMDDIVVVNGFFKFKGNDCLTQDDIGKVVTCGKYYYGDDSYRWKTGLRDTILKYLETVDKMIDEVENFGKESQ